VLQLHDWANAMGVRSDLLVRDACMCGEADPACATYVEWWLRRGSFQSATSRGFALRQAFLLVLLGHVVGLDALLRR